MNGRLSLHVLLLANNASGGAAAIIALVDEQNRMTPELLDAISHAEDKTRPGGRNAFFMGKISVSLHVKTAHV